MGSIAIGHYKRATQTPRKTPIRDVYVVLLLVTCLHDSFSTDLPTSVKAEIAWPGLIAGVVMVLWALVVRPAPHRPAAVNVRLMAP